MEAPMNDSMQILPKSILDTALTTGDLVPLICLERQL